MSTGAEKPPVAFVASTIADLQRHRDKVKDAILDAGFIPDMSEFFSSAAEIPVKACQAKAADCDVLVVISAHCYGHTPTKGNKSKKSITWLECEAAKKNGKDILAFLVDEDYTWPGRSEETELHEAIQRGDPIDELRPKLERVHHNLKKLVDFQNWLKKGRLSKRFTTPEDLAGKVRSALENWRRNRLPSHVGSSREATVLTENQAKQILRQLLAQGKSRKSLAAECGVSSGVLSKALAGDQSVSQRSWDKIKIAVAGQNAEVLISQATIEDPTRYLKELQRQTTFIDIRGLHVGMRKASRFPIEKIYVRLRARSSTGSEVALVDAVQERPVVILGDPGSGKSTFLNRLAYGLCRHHLQEDRKALDKLGISTPYFPVLVRLNELARHIETLADTPGRAATRKQAAVWLPHFLAAVSQEKQTGLDQASFQQRLESGSTLLLLDGLDEAPDRPTRELLSRLIEDLAATYPRCSLIVTTRPAAYADKAVIPEFEHFEIEPLADAGIQEFLIQWCRQLYPKDRQQANRHFEELYGVLNERLDIRHLVENPVMLTAMVVVHWNEKTLPEQRVDLYESIIKWLSRSREDRKGRERAERCVRLLQALALKMQNHPGGRRSQVTQKWAAEAIGTPDLWRQEPISSRRIELADEFLNEEKLDSGIIGGEESGLRFWHLTFQEYLAARAISGMSEENQKELLLGGQDRRFYETNWFEVVLLLFGILFEQGEERLDKLIDDVLDDLGPGAGLPRQAKCVGILGAAMRELQALGYIPNNPGFAELLNRVMGIFERDRAEEIPLEDRIRAAAMLGRAGDPRLDPKNKNRWVIVPRGTFLMGAQGKDPSGDNFDPDAESHEAIQTIKLPEFRISRYLVTVADFQKFVDNVDYGSDRWWCEGGRGLYERPLNWEQQLQSPNLPVVGVSWYEAMAFSAWAGSNGAWQGCRLPNEAEWERAARGKENRLYPWGKEAEVLENQRSFLTSVIPVGVNPHAATPDGIQDMAGNAWEWCLDDYAPKYRYVANGKRSPSGQDAVVRGGAWHSKPKDMRCSCRVRCPKDERNPSTGFRLVRP